MCFYCLKKFFVLLIIVWYNVHESNEPCGCNERQNGCLQPNLAFRADIGRMPVSEEARGFRACTAKFGKCEVTRKPWLSGVHGEMAHTSERRSIYVYSGNSG